MAILKTNGYIEKTNSRGRSVTIEDVDGLHRAIGESLARNRKTLDGREARFLRLEMGLTQLGLARLLGKSEQAIARWEKQRLAREEKISENSERMIRLLYLETIGENTPLKEFLESIAGLENLSDMSTSFHETDCGWEPIAA